MNFIGGVDPVGQVEGTLGTNRDTGRPELIAPPHELNPLVHKTRARGREREEIDAVLAP